MRTIFTDMLLSAASIAITAGLVASAAPGVAAVPQTTTTQIRVGYTDLDLHSADGRATLDRRIRSAAGRVCATGDLSERLAGAACRRQAIAGAHRDLDARIAATSSAIQVAAN